MLRRALWVLVVLFVVVLAYTAWLAWQIQGELRAAESSATELRSAWQSQDVSARDVAAADLADDAGAASDHASNLWWRFLGHLPLIGDDVDGITAMSRSLDIIAQDAVGPLGEAVDSVDGIVAGGRVDLTQVEALEAPVADAHEALVAADEEVSALDSDGYVGALRTRFDRYADLVHGLRSGFASAETATEIAPTMLGADGPRNFLLIFQNNAEIRATGGLPGSWALVRADRGKLAITQQGSANDFPVPARPIAPLTDAELAVYSSAFGTYFHNPGFTPDFPRASELWRAHWRASNPDIPLHGILALDPVAMSYLLAGTGPVQVDDVTLTPETVVPSLLNEPYLKIDDALAQDRYFEKAARSIFGAVTGDVQEPVAFVEGLNRAAGEGRLLIASFEDHIRKRLSGTAVGGALAGDDGATPHVDIGLNDLTGSKMSYYLRYDGEVSAANCQDGRQQLVGDLTLRQVIAPDRAASLPDAVTGGGAYGTEPGAQYVMVRLYGPYGGSVDEVRLNGRTLTRVEPVELDGRPVVSVDVLLTSRREVRLAWEVTAGQGQTEAGEFSMTPSIVPGDDRQSFASAC